MTYDIQTYLTNIQKPFTNYQLAITNYHKLPNLNFHFKLHRIPYIEYNAYNTMQDFYLYCIKELFGENYLIHKLKKILYFLSISESSIFVASIDGVKSLKQLYNSPLPSSFIDAMEFP